MTGFTVQGGGWANVLSDRLGYIVRQGEPYYSSNCDNTSPSSSTGCVFPNAEIPQAAWDPVVSHLFQYIPNANTS